LLVQRKIGDSPLETAVLLLKFLETTGLLNLQPAIFLSLSVIALLRYANPPANLADRSTLSK
jgi:hypothetical protein